MQNPKTKLFAVRALIKSRTLEIISRSESDAIVVYWPRLEKMNALSRKKKMYASIMAEGERDA